MLIGPLKVDCQCTGSQAVKTITGMCKSLPPSPFSLTSTYSFKNVILMRRAMLITWPKIKPWKKGGLGENVTIARLMVSP
jgi:hypothetical protein